MPFDFAQAELRDQKLTTDIGFKNWTNSLSAEKLTIYMGDVYST